MDYLEQMIWGMAKEEARFYKLTLKRFSPDSERKDEALFDAIRQKGEKYNEDRIFRKLYGENGDKNAFYRLKNRLAEDLHKSLLEQHFFKNDALYALNYLTLARMYAGRNQFKLAHFLLTKAEKKARQSEDFELLDLVYSLYIKLSMEIVSINPENYIEKRKENYEQLKLYREIDDLTAALNYRLKISQNYGATADANLSLLQRTVDEFAQHPEARKSARIRLKIYHAVTQILLQTHNYPTLEVYAMKIFQEFTDEKLFNKTNHEDKLQILTYIVNSLFKNGKFEESLYYTEILGKEIEAFDRIFFDKFAFFFYNAQVINYSQIEPDKAISILDSLKNDEHLKAHSFYQVFVYLNLSLLWFGKKNFKKSIRELTQLFIHENYKNVDISLRFKIAIFELMIRYDLNEPEMLSKRIEQVKKEYETMLETQTRDSAFVNLLEKMLDYDDSLEKNEKKCAIELFLNRADAAESDSEVYQYNDWLKNYL